MGRVRHKLLLPTIVETYPYTLATLTQTCYDADVALFPWPANESALCVADHEIVLFRAMVPSIDPRDSRARVGPLEESM